MNLEQILSIRRSLGGEGGDAHLAKVRQLLKPPCAPTSDKNEVGGKGSSRASLRSKREAVPVKRGETFLFLLGLKGASSQEERVKCFAPEFAHLV